MKNLIYLTALIPIFSYGEEEKYFSEIIDSNEIIFERLETNELLGTSEITLLNKAGDEGEYEIHIEALKEESFEDQANEDVKNNSCDKSTTEKIVCANIMCDFGLLFGEWSSECTDYKLDLALAVAKLLPWDSLPNCIAVDSDCNKSGKAQENEADEYYCNEIIDLTERHQCLMALDMNNKAGATEFIERNGGNSDDLNSIDFIDSDPEEVGTYFLVNYVDTRFNFEDELVEYLIIEFPTCTHHGSICDTLSFKTDTQPMAELSFFLEFRYDAAYADEIEETRKILVDQDIMLPQCEEVSFNEFFNCNFYPDLPQQCWSAQNHEAIIECIDNVDDIF